MVYMPRYSIGGIVMTLADWMQALAESGLEKRDVDYVMFCNRKNITTDEPITIGEYHRETLREEETLKTSTEKPEKSWDNRSPS